MKLINKAKLPDKILEQTLKLAAHSLGKRISTDIVVYVGTTSTHTSKGLAIKCTAVRWDNRWRKTRGGAFRIWIGIVRPGTVFDGLKLAESFFETAQHEFGHIYDFQYEKRTHNRLDWAPRKNGRRMSHQYRPEEKRVDEYLSVSKDKNLYADMILNLAIELEKL